MSNVNKDLITSQAFFVRALQAFIYRLFAAKQIPGPIHFAFGHEYLACSVMSYVHSPNFLFLPHRNMHYQIASCFSSNSDFNTSLFRRYVDELTLSLCQRETGYLGAMNYTHGQSTGYTSSILANQLGVAIGSCLATATRYLQQNHRTVAVIGDGALEEGRFWEALIMMKTQNLSMDILIEDNDWSMQSSRAQRRCKINLKTIAEGFDIEFVEAQDPTSLTNYVNGPRLILCGIETLGSNTSKKNASGEERVINYHAGALPDHKTRTHYTDFFSMSPSDRLQRDLIPQLFQEQLGEILVPLNEKFKIKGFL